LTYGRPNPHHGAFDPNSNLVQRNQPRAFVVGGDKHIHKWLKEIL
jgi:hypothetical protein